MHPRADVDALLQLCCCKLRIRPDLGVDSGRNAPQRSPLADVVLPPLVYETNCGGIGTPVIVGLTWAKIARPMHAHGSTGWTPSPTRSMGSAVATSVVIGTWLRWCSLVLN